MHADLDFHWKKPDTLLYTVFSASYIFNIFFSKNNIRLLCHVTYTLLIQCPIKLPHREKKKTHLFLLIMQHHLFAINCQRESIVSQNLSSHEMKSIYIFKNQRKSLNITKTKKEGTEGDDRIGEDPSSEPSKNKFMLQTALEK